jgi:hypothetical protein
MSYIGAPFKYDVCVSYSHGDPKGAGASKFKSYSQALIRELATELKAHPTFGAELSLFFDDSQDSGSGLDRMAGLTSQLRGAMGESAIFTVLMSDHYLRSGWCKDEREFWQSNTASSGLAYNERIALARIWDTTASWPAMLVDERGHPLVGVYFYERARLPDYQWPYDWPEPGPQSRDPFRKELLSLVGSIWQQITRLKARMDAHRKAQADVARLIEDTGQVLYLHGRADHADKWTEASEALSKNGFTVFPSEPDVVESDPVRAQKIRERRVETLSGCDALLLVASKDGPAVEADLVVVGRHDRDSARALGKRPLPCALLDTEGGLIATSRRTEAAKRLRVDWLDCTQPPWTAKVQDWLTRKGTEAQSSI